MADEEGTRWVRRSAVINNTNFNDELKSLMNIAGHAIETVTHMAKFNAEIITAFEDEEKPPDYGTMVRTCLHLGKSSDIVLAMLEEHMAFYKQMPEVE